MFSIIILILRKILNWIKKILIFLILFSFIFLLIASFILLTNIMINFNNKQVSNNISNLEESTINNNENYKQKNIKKSKILEELLDYNNKYTMEKILINNTKKINGNRPEETIKYKNILLKNKILVLDKKQKLMKKKRTKRCKLKKKLKKHNMLRKKIEQSQKNFVLCKNKEQSLLFLLNKVKIDKVLKTEI